MSAEVRVLGSNVDFWEVADRDEMAESIDEVRGMTRWVGRSPGADTTELTEEDWERSGSRTTCCLDGLLALGRAFKSATDELAISGDPEADVEGGAGNVALAIRETGERFCAGDALALVRGESGL